MALAVLTVVLSLFVGVSDAGAINSVGPGYGLAPGGHNNGAYSVTTTNGQVLGFCITPGLAGPDQVPSAVYTPLGSLPDGGRAYLGYFAETFQGGFGTYTTNDVDAAVAYIAYGGSGTAPAGLVSIIQTGMADYPGPWAITTTPVSGGSYTTSSSYNGDVTVTAANGSGVPGLAVTAPATGGPGQWSSFGWVPNMPTDVTDAQGHLPFEFSQTAAGPFLEGFSIVGGAPGAAPVDYQAPPGSGGQSILAAATGPSPSSLISGTMVPPIYATAAVQVTKSDADSIYVPVPAGVGFDVVDAGNNVIDTLTTVSGGVAGPSPANIPVGSYTIVEVSVPPGSGLALNSTPMPFAITNADIGGTTPVTVTVPFVDNVVTGSLVIEKTDRATSTGLAGAQFTVSFDPSHTGTYNQQVAGPNSDGSFTTDPTGRVIDPSGALTTLVPGDYRVTETAAPPGHALPSPAFQDVIVPVGGATITATFTDQTVPTIGTTATGVSQLGMGITDSATLMAASAHATGTITFRAYGPFASTAEISCTPSKLVFSSTPVTIEGIGTYPMATVYEPPSIGIYQWIESYSGDANNTSVSGSCGDAGESSVVVSVTTTATRQASNGAPIADTVVIQGPLPTGSVITSTLYRTSDTTCSAPLWTSPPTITGQATSYTLDGITVPAGSYQWVEAVHLATGTPVATGSCNAAEESSTVLAGIPAATQSSVSGTAAAVAG